ncbi:MAG: arylamine N-acetyltransferase [Propionibacterium sp.]|nr:arylamine N-acetyltransferase [Propionibacterium sp.]
MRRLLAVVALLIAIAVVPVVRRAPRPRGTGATVERIAERLIAGGATGRELADEAIRDVALAVGHHSAWHLWESPRQSLRHGRGWSHQYNTALMLVLRELGFDAKLVHAARVRGFGHPWFMSGHTWVKVRIDGYWLDACASSMSNRVGSVGFVPLTEELPLYRRTRWAIGLALSPFVVDAVWRAWLSGDEMPAWVYEERR